MGSSRGKIYLLGQGIVRSELPRVCTIEDGSARTEVNCLFREIRGSEPEQNRKQDRERQGKTEERVGRWIGVLVVNCLFVVLLQGMGNFNSSRRDGPITTTKDEPVMGEGYCPFYDAASVGDWEKLQQLCQGAKSQDKRQNEIENICDNFNALTPRKNCDGGHDYSDTPGLLDTPDSTQTSEENVTNAQQLDHQFTDFVDKRGHTCLHVGCRRDPPLSAVKALIGLHPKSVLLQTPHDKWLPIHFACYCGCSAEVANELLNAMEREIKNANPPRESLYDDPMLPRDHMGRNPVHLVLQSGRNPKRRPDLIRLLLLRSKNPQAAALVKIDLDQRIGEELASGQFNVISGSLFECDNNEESSDQCNQSTTDQHATISTGRSPLDLIEDDYREEIQYALESGVSLTQAIATCRGGPNCNTENMDLFEAWAVLSMLLLSAGTPGSIESVKEALGGLDCQQECNLSLEKLKPIQDIVSNFHAVHQACASLDKGTCPSQFRDITKKFLTVHIDEQKLDSVHNLTKRFENLTKNRKKTAKKN